MSFFELSRKNRFKSWLHNKPDDEKAAKDDEDDNDEEDEEDDDDEARQRKAARAPEPKQEEEKMFYDDKEYQPDNTFLRRQGYRLQYGPFYDPSWRQKPKSERDGEDGDDEDEDDEDEEAKKKEFTPAPEVFPKYHADHYKEEYDETHRSHFRPLDPYKPFPVRPMKINDLRNAEFGTSMSTRYTGMEGNYWPKIKQQRRVSPATSADGFSDPEPEDKEPEVLFYDGPVKYPDPGGPIKYTDPGYYLYKNHKPWPMRVLDVGTVKPTEGENTRTEPRKPEPSPKRTPTPPPPPPPKEPTPSPTPTPTPPRRPPPPSRGARRQLTEEELERLKWTEVDSLIAGTQASGATDRIVLAPVYGATPLLASHAPRLVQPRPPPSYAPYLTRPLFPAPNPTSRPRMSAEYSSPKDPHTALQQHTPPPTPPPEDYRLAVLSQQPRHRAPPREARAMPPPPKRSSSPPAPPPPPPDPLPAARPKPSLKTVAKVALGLQKKNGLYTFSGVRDYDHLYAYEKGRDGELHVVRKDKPARSPSKLLRFARGVKDTPRASRLPPEVVATVSAYNVAHSR